MLRCPLLLFIKGFFLKRSIIVFILLIIVSLFTLFAFYLPLCNSSFYGDDTQIMWFAATKSAGEIFFSPENYRAHSGAFFQPMLGFSFKIDWLLSGLNPKGYYIHNMVSVLLTAIALYLFLKLYVNYLPAMIGSILFILNPVVISLFSYSTNRHYVEGMFFAVLAFYFYVRHDRLNNNILISDKNPPDIPLLKGGRWGFLILSSFFYLLSALCKEVYVFLPAIVFIISGGNIIRRFKSTFPLWIILCIYLVWRFVMIGGIGGYPFDDLLTAHKITAGIYNLLENMSKFLFGPYSIIFWIVLPVMVITTQPKNIILTGFIVIVLLLPVLPVLTLIGLHYAFARYVFHLSVFLIFIGILWGSETMQRKGWKRIFVAPVLIIVGTFFVVEDNAVKHRVYQESITMKRTIKEFLFSGDEYIKAEQPAWFYYGLRDIYEYFYGVKIHTKVIPYENLIKYLSEERRKEILSAGYPIGIKNGQEVRKDGVHGSIRLDRYTMQWDFEPYATGRYLIIMGRYQGLYGYATPVKRKGKYLFGQYYPDGRPDVFFMKVVYQSPEGWEGVTDEFGIEIPGTYLIELK